MIKALFWDNDGVLVDTEHIYFEATAQVLAEVGAKLTRELYIELFLRDSKGAWHLARERGLDQGAVAELRDRRNALYLQYLTEQAAVIAGVSEVLESLCQRYCMGIVTSSRREAFKLIHSTTGLLKYFEFVLVREDYGKSKPDPEPYLTAVQRSGCAPEECVVIEDSPRGLTAAKQAGLQCFVIPTGFTAGLAFPTADRILCSVSELPELLAELT